MTENVDVAVKEKLCPLFCQMISGGVYPFFSNTFLLTRTWVCMGLDDPTCSECLPVWTCDHEPPEHVPRMSARAHTCTLVFRRASCVPRTREHEKRPAAGREKMPMSQKNTFIHNNMSSSHPAVADALCLSLLPLSQIPLEYCCR